MDPGVKVEILRKGRTVLVTDSRTGSELRLKSGTYRVALQGDRNDLTVTPDEIMMERGGRQTVRIRRVPAPTVEPDTPESTEFSSAWERLRSRAEEIREADPHLPAAAELRWQLVQFARLQAATEHGVKARQLAAQLPWPADLLRRENIPALEMQAAGFGNAAAVHPAVVAILGDSRWKQWRPVRALACSADGRHVATGDSVGNVILWDGESGRPQHWLFGHTSYVRELAFSPDADTLATASDDRTIRLWNTADGRLLSELKSHTASVTTVAFDPSSRRLASGSHDGTIVVWDRRGEELRTIKATGAVQFVAFSSQGAMLAAGTGTHRLQVWDRKRARCWRISRDTTPP